MLKIVCTGPESSGKTTMARLLAAHFSCIWVPEYARDFLNRLGRAYRESDLLDIAKGQHSAIMKAAKNAHSLLICDTDLLTIHIWGMVKYKRSHPWIDQQMEQSDNTLYLLCRPDIPWEPDPLRENPDDRDALFIRYENKLQQLNKRYFIVEGTPSNRTTSSIARIQQILNSETY
ncbi:MAG: ATP-binding protein [Bacteroidota bacterium]